MGSHTKNRPQAESITEEQIQAFIEEMRRKNRSASTLETYSRTMAALYAALPEKKLDASTWDFWKGEMLRQNFQPGTVNQRLSVPNSYLRHIGRKGWCGNEFVPVEKTVQPELTRNEYKRLLSAAKLSGREKTYFLIKVMGGAGIGVGELPYLTAEAVERGCVSLPHGRPISLPEPLRAELAAYIKRNAVKNGPIFQTASGQPIDRSNLYRVIGSLGADAVVDPAKATPKCLLKMYRQTRKDIEEHIAILAEQSYQRMLEEEQHALGWEEA